MKIAGQCVVSLEYPLKNSAGEVLDQATDQDPLNYLHGANNIIVGLERELTGKQEGDEFEATIAPADAYGEKLAELVRTYCNRAQYIIISHNDGVITEADNLYGVSMDEHGMSKVVSLKI